MTTCPGASGPPAPPDISPSIPASLLRLAWENAADGMRVTDATGTVLAANPAYCRLVGRDEAEVVGRPLSDVYAPARRGEILRRYADRFSRRSVRGQYETEVELWDGRPRWFEVTNAFLDTPGEPERLLSLFRDVTDRKRVEEARRSSERHLRAVIEASPECVKLVARDGTLLEMNPAGLAMLEAGEVGPLRGRPVWDRIAPEDRAAFRELHQAVCDGRPGALEYSIVGLRGTRRRVETHAVPLPGPDGRPLHLAVTRDVTERKRLEDQLRQAQKLEAVGRLAGGIAHDFNNLLTVINGYCDLLAPTVPAGGLVRDAVLAVRDAGERAAALTRQLLALGRKAIVEPKVLDLNEAVARTGRLLRRLIGEDVALVTAPAPGLSPVRIDPGQLEQVLLNLCVNARDAMPGGGRLTIETGELAAAEVAAAYPGLAPGRYVRLVVSDTGCGMTEEVKAHVFEPFFTTKGPGKGTGLGLATVYGIVKACGGHVGVYSEVGVGTTFKVLLPAAAAGAAAAPPPPAAAAPRGGETVLLVEDEEAVRAVARITLQSYGYSVLEAGTGEEAVRVAGTHPRPLDLLVTDVVMPGMGGRATAEALRRDRPGLRVLYMSGYTDDAVVRHGVIEATDAFLQKPFAPVALACKVRAVLDGAG